MDNLQFLTPKILSIKGVSKADCISDDMYEKQILENIHETENSTVILDEFLNNNIISHNISASHYTKLPPFFTTIEEWVNTTNILCWYCHLNFDSVPVFIPKIIEPMIFKSSDSIEIMNIYRNQDVRTENKFSIGVLGVFCSFGCAHSFINGGINRIDKIEQKNKLNFLYKQYYGVSDKNNYSQYPSPHIMIQYGGDITVEEYKIKTEKYMK